MVDSEEAARIIGAVVRAADDELDDAGIGGDRHRLALAIANRVREILEAVDD